MSEQLNHGARILIRAQALIANKGYGWSKAISIARDLTGDDERTEDEVLIAEEPEEKIEEAIE